MPVQLQRNCDAYNENNDVDARHAKLSENFTNCYLPFNFEHVDADFCADARQVNKISFFAGFA